MTTRKSNKNQKPILWIAIVIALGLAISAFAQRGTTTPKQTVLTDPNLAAAQRSQDQLKAAIAQRDEALRQSAEYQHKLELTQLEYRTEAKNVENRHQAELDKERSTKEQYARLYAHALQPVPWYATWWFCLVCGCISGITGLKFVQWAKKVHGGFWRWVSHIWSLRPRVTVSRPTHG